jgi:hypothetical protein
MRQLALTLGTIAILAAAMLVSGTTDLQAGHVFNVTITNATRGQVITPPVLFSHNTDFQLFTVGELASLELYSIAEDGNTAPLEILLDSSSDVGDYTVSPNGLGPGESVTLQVEVNGMYRQITAVGMLATTNDAFMAIKNVAVPANFLKKVLVAYAYDAGSETNNELCDFIPGPPCENPFQRDTSGAEGFVHIHSGIHGSGDLDPADFGWHNPVAIITIDRMPTIVREINAQ